MDAEGPVEGSMVNFRLGWERLGETELIQGTREY